VADSREDADGGRASEKQQPRRRQHGLDVDFHGTSAVTSHGKENHPWTLPSFGLGRKAEKPRLAVGDRAHRFAQNARARAPSARPAVILAPLRDQRDVSDLRRAGGLAPHDGDERKALLASGEVSGECQQFRAQGVLF